MFKEFKEFAMKGNLIDMAIGLVMGAAFGKVATAFTEGMIMPIVGKLVGGVDFKNLKYVIQDAVMGANGKETAAEVSIKYGEFINSCVDFFIVAFVMFMVVKAINAARKDTAMVAPPPTPQEELLAEIRDLLKKQR
ncbi:MAG: large conductance mechanosensitive channel protein MscL [Bacteroidota bacterium]|jgi:large conductance mechanosensitive channel